MNVICEHPELFIGSGICLHKAQRRLNYSGKKTLFLLES